jgi:uncharacterized membrane protein (GlpM family)
VKSPRSEAICLAPNFLFVLSTWSVLLNVYIADCGPTFWQFNVIVHAIVQREETSFRLKNFFLVQMFKQYFKFQLWLKIVDILHKLKLKLGFHWEHWLKKK